MLSEWTEHFGIHLHRKPTNASKWSLYSDHNTVVILMHLLVFYENVNLMHVTEFIFLRLHYKVTVTLEQATKGLEGE
jgi:hypothetical protein